MPDFEKSQPSRPPMKPDWTKEGAYTGPREERALELAGAAAALRSRLAARIEYMEGERWNYGRVVEKTHPDVPDEETGFWISKEQVLARSGYEILERKWKSFKEKWLIGTFGVGVAELAILANDVKNSQDGLEINSVGGMVVFGACLASALYSALQEKLASNKNTKALSDPPTPDELRSLSKKI